MNLIHDLTFFAGGSGLECLGRNWHTPESRFIWAARHASALCFDIPANHAGYFVELSMRSYRGKRHVSLWSNGHFFGRFDIGGSTKISLLVPKWCIFDKKLVLNIYHYDGAKVSDVEHGSTDDRVLSVAIDAAKVYGTHLCPQIIGQNTPSPALELSSSELMSKFQSLGDNCEFGIVQRSFGTEALGLLRFSGMGITEVVHGLATRFEGLCADGHLTLQRASATAKDSEFIVTHDYYGLNQHTHVFSDDTNAEILLQKTKVRLAREAAMLFDDLEDAEKIFVVKRGNGHDGFELQDVLPLWSAMRSYGRNTLLYVAIATGDKILGTVERKASGLYCGYIDHFFSYQDGGFDITDDCWLAVCRNAYDLWIEDQKASFSKYEDIRRNVIAA